MSHASRQSLDLIPLRSKPGNTVDFDEENAVRLEGAHREEIVRSVCLGDAASATVFTAGEDGRVRAWRVPSDADQAESGTTRTNKTTKTSKGEKDEIEDLKERPGSSKKSSTRFKPY